MAQVLGTTTTVVQGGHRGSIGAAARPSMARAQSPSPQANAFVSGRTSMPAARIRGSMSPARPSTTLPYPPQTVPMTAPGGMLGVTQPAPSNYDLGPVGSSYMQETVARPFQAETTAMSNLQISPPRALSPMPGGVSPGIPLGGPMRMMTPAPAPPVITTQVQAPFSALRQSGLTLSAAAIPAYSSPLPPQVHTVAIPMPYQQPVMQSVVPVPVTVLSHIDSVVSEMERELSDIQAVELRQEAHLVRDSHLSQLRRILAEDLLRGREQELEHEAGRLSVLEMDHMAVKKHVLELDSQRCKAEQERDELVHIRAALEGECEARLNELQSLAETVDSEKRRNASTEQEFNERIQVLVTECQGLKQCKSELRDVLNNCQQLQLKVQELETEGVQFRCALADRDNEINSLRATDALRMERIMELEMALEQSRSRVEGLEVEREEQLLAKILALESTVSDHEGNHGKHMSRIRELEILLEGHSRQLEEHASGEQRHLDTHTTNRNKIRMFEERVQEYEAQMLEKEGHHGRQHAANREKILELEDQLTGLHRQKQTLSVRTREKELEEELQGAMSEKDNHIRKHTTRIRELEQLLEEMRLADEKHQKTHVTNRSKHTELEQLIIELQATDGNHSRKHTTNQQRILDLEQQLLELQGAHDKHKNEAGMHKRKTMMLTQELENGFNEGDKVRQDKAHRAALLAIEERLVEAELARDKYMQEKSAERQKVMQIETLLEDLRRSDEGHHRQHGTHKSRIAELELDHENIQSGHRDKHRDLNNRILELEREVTRVVDLERASVRELEDARLELDENLRLIREIEAAVPQAGTIDSIDKRVLAMMQTIEAERRDIDQSRQEVAAARIAAEEVKLDADRVVASQEKLMTAKMAELEDALVPYAEENKILEATVRSCEDRCSQLLIEKREMEIKYNEVLADMNEARKMASLVERRSITVTEPTYQAPPANTLVVPGSTNSSRRSITARKSLFGDVQSIRTYLKGELLPGNMDPFVVKVRQATTVVADALKMASEAHMMCIKSQVQILLDSQESGDLKSLINDYEQKREIDSERQSASSNVESAIHDLRAYKEEMAIQHHLPASDREAIAERIELDLTKCEDELALLQEDSSLDGLPEHVLRMLVDFHASGPDHAWADGLSPMHWAAHNGRHDLVMYLLSLDGGRTLLQTHDNTGRNPIYYAQLGKHKALQMWLQEEIGEASSVHREENTPDFSQIPETYLKVLQQIRTHGWRSMSWRDDYTMLHWAANKGHSDLCQYLVGVDADPSARDGQGRTPIDLAITHGNQELVNVLQSLRTQRRQSRRF